MLVEHPLQTKPPNCIGSLPDTVPATEVMRDHADVENQASSP
jgi:hypothetical protein